METRFNFTDKQGLVKYLAIAYYRLSKDDGNRSESDSILNQRKLVLNYVSTHEEIKLVEEAYDDGYTGTNYNRPGFLAVMNAIDAGKVNCVIVKDLSRLGREYIETGKYIDMIFPEKGVRFIAINDDFDTDHSRSGDEIVIPIKNIMNEAYCRELSRKLRNQFKIQRGNGEFLGAFACYGYLKDPADKHKLVVDEYAAQVVKRIFSMKQQGFSHYDIADTLNREGILSPSEYKRSLGLNYKTGLKSSSISRWGHMTVRNILSNPVYKGDLVQGMRGTPNYKLKTMRYRKAEEWIVVEHNHEPIIDTSQFEIVQKLLSRDTRKSPTEDILQPLSGLLFCGDCGMPMCRRSVKRGNRKFNYYICSSYKKRVGCKSHCFEQKKLERIVLEAIQSQIKLVIETQHFLDEIDHDSVLANKVRSIDLMIAEKDKEIDGYQSFRMKLYESLNEGIILVDEYNYMREKYTEMINCSLAALDKLQEDRKSILAEKAIDKTWIKQFEQYQNISELSRDVAVTLIDRICIFEDKRMKIAFSYRNEFELFSSIMNNFNKEAGKDAKEESI